MDWCLNSFSEANHPPIPVVNHDENITVKSGEGFFLDATGSHDPDGDNLSYLWFPYPEIGSLQQRVDIAYAENLVKVFIVAPEVSKTETTQYILKVTDKGNPPISRYKRVNVRIEPEWTFYRQD